MIDKILIIKKLEHFFNKINLENFLKIFIINFLYDKVNYIEKIVGHDNCLNILDKYIYNIEQNIRFFKKLDKYHSIYAKYDFKTKSLIYYMTNDYTKIKNIYLLTDNKKSFLIKEFKIMMYKELEKIINIYSMNGKIISNGFYIEDKNGRYPDYDGHFSNIMDIFSDVEVCNIINLNDRIKTYIDENKEYFVYSKHISKRNSEVMCYTELWKKFIDKKLYYFAINNPKMYAEKMINDFNLEYEFVLNEKYEFMLKNKDVFSLIENYLLHIKERIEIENNIQYHQELSLIFKLMNTKKNIYNFKDYILHSLDGKNKLIFEK